MATQKQYIEFFKNQALGTIGRSPGFENALQSGLGFYKGRVWQKGYGFGGIFGALARRVLPVLKPIAKFLAKRALKTGGQVIRDVTKGQSIGDALAKGAKQFVGLKGSDKKRRRTRHPVIAKKRLKRADVFSEKKWLKQ